MERAGPPRSLGLLTFVLAAAAGLSVANLYYAQPVLRLLAATFHTGVGSVTLVVTVTQIGYAVGLFVVTPLGDLVEARRLTPALLLVTAVSLTVAALARSRGVFLAASLVVGASCVVAQIFVPFAAHLAPEERRGQVVGRVMSGLLLGILLARTVSSEVAAALGWRAMFGISAALMVLLAAAVARLLPERRPDHRAGYLSLLTSVVGLVRTLPALRRRAVTQALLFFAFSAFWTAIAYELMDRHGFSQADVGLFALVGATGATVAPTAGWLADRGHSGWFGGVALSAGVAGMLSAWLGRDSVVLLALAGVLLDVAVTGHQIVSQREIYALRPDARARLTTVYIGTMFIGGAIGSALAGPLYRDHGWSGVAIASALTIAGARAIWVRASLRARRRLRPACDPAA
jgi:predicted MFS family arabinose efflux permease